MQLDWELSRGNEIARWHPNNKRDYNNFKFEIEEDSRKYFSTTAGGNLGNGFEELVISTNYSRLNFERSQHLFLRGQWWIIEDIKFKTNNKNVLRFIKPERNRTVILKIYQAEWIEDNE